MRLTRNQKGPNLPSRSLEFLSIKSTTPVSKSRGNINKMVMSAGPTMGFAKAAEGKSSSTAVNNIAVIIVIFPPELVSVAIVNYSKVI